MFCIVWRDRDGQLMATGPFDSQDEGQQELDKMVFEMEWDNNIQEGCCIPLEEK